MSTEVAFPVYRKYPNGKSFFKITSYNAFEEIKVLGKKSERHLFEVRIYPDMQLIADMILMKDRHWVVSTAEEFQSASKAST